MCRAGFGEVEVHLHHDADTPEHLGATLGEFVATLRDRHGLLSRDAAGRVAYAFIHGNWALNNARPDGRWCGVNDEIAILRGTGCYADLTLPAAPDPCQTTTVNSIYYATGDHHRPKGHDRGRRAAVGRTAPADALLMIQGPLALGWKRRGPFVVPRVENGQIDRATVPTLERFRQWVDVGIAVEGRPEWVFVKIHTHGAPERNADVLLGPATVRFHEAIGRAFNDGSRYRLHYVTAREMANIVKAAEDGATGNPNDYRDYRIASTIRRAAA